MVVKGSVCDSNGAHRVGTRGFLVKVGTFITGMGHRVGTQGFVVYLQGLLSLLR